MAPLLLTKKSVSPVVIRYLADQPEVIPVIASWIYNEWSFLYAGKTRRYVEDFLRERLHKKKLPITLVASLRGKPVGTVSLKESDLETRPDLTPWVTSLFVVERFRGKGIGARLMDAVELKAARLGIKKLFLFTADPDLATRFYSRLGWHRKEETEYQSYRVIIMEKKL